MSLLNEALRKKTGEKSGSGQGTRVFSDMRRSPSSKAKSVRLLAAACACAGIVAAAWLWLASSQPIEEKAAARQLPPPSAGDNTDRSAPASTPSAAAGGAVAAAVTSVQSKDIPTTAVTDKASSVTADKGTANAALAKQPSRKRTAVAKAPEPGSPSPVPAQTADTSGPTPEQIKLARPYWEKALSYHRDGQFTQAIVMYSEVLKKAPGHAEALLNLSAVHIETHAFSEAYPLLQNLGARFPQNSRVWLNLAIAEIGLAKPAAALLDLRRAEQTGADGFDIYLHRGAALSQLGKGDEALASYKQAEQIKPKEPSLAFNLALVHDRQKNFTEALDYYQRYLGLSNTSDTAQMKLVEERIAVLRAYLVAGNQTN